MLVAFMIENAPALFGQDITCAFAFQNNQKTELIGTGTQSPSSSVSMDDKDNQSTTSAASSEQVDSGLASPDEASVEEAPTGRCQVRQQIVVRCMNLRPMDCVYTDNVVGRHVVNSNYSGADLNLSRATDDSATTSILIVNSPRKQTVQWLPEIESVYL